MIRYASALVGKTHLQWCVAALRNGRKIYPRRVFFGNGKNLLENTTVTIFYCKGIISTKLIVKNTCRWVGSPVAANGIEILWLPADYIAERNPTITQPTGGGGGSNGGAGRDINYINTHRQNFAATVI